MNQAHMSENIPLLQLECESRTSLLIPLLSRMK
jgi:hypothetical protein